MSDIWTQEGWLYLAVLLDLYSRKVVGWSLGSRLLAQLRPRVLLAELACGGGVRGIEAARWLFGGGA